VEKDGGSNCANNMPASDSHTPLRRRWAAAQVSSSRGPGGRDISVMSVGKQVIALNKSLSACTH
jgi:hypothetical protein